ncbi:alpha-L-rhamnosidase C-terminal domain-containing protein [Lacisediminihabitans sp. FW035]
MAELPLTTVSSGRVETFGPEFDRAALPPRPGRAGWLWLASHDETPVTALFRGEVILPSEPLSGRLWFSADAHARIFVNGVLVARGPDDGGQDYLGEQTGRWMVNFRELGGVFVPGRNVIAAEVFTAEAMAGRYNTTGAGGLLLECELDLADGGTHVIVADETWRCALGDEWSFAPWVSPDTGIPEPRLRFSGERERVGWRSPAFDDADWATCVAASGCWPPLMLSELPPRTEAVYPATGVRILDGDLAIDGEEILFAGKGRCAVDFDRVFSAFIGLRVTGVAGTVLAIRPNEAKEPGHNRMATIVLRDGEQVLELPFYDSFSTIHLETITVTGPLAVIEVRATFVALPVRYDGSFECSDASLDRLWEASRWLTQICQQTHHLDSPHHQEPISDPGDYLIIALDNYYAFGQPHLARQDLRKYALLLRATGFAPFHTSYALLWLQMLRDYERYTGDASLTVELAPEVHGLLARFATYRGRTGILSEAPDYMFLDWVDIGGFPAHHPPSVIGQGYLTALYYRALADGIEVAERCGEAALVDRYTEERRCIHAAFSRELWNDSTGLFRDGVPFVTAVEPHEWLPADRDIETFSTQVNALAVLYDLAPADRRESIMRRLAAGNLNVQPYFMHFVFAAFDHAGVFDELALTQLRRWTIDADTGTFREMWDAGDYSHAWQCTPLFQLSARVLGVTPLTDGFTSVRIRPSPIGLDWARGTVPTPRGDIDVHWARATGEFRLSCTLPIGTTAEIELPPVDGADLTVDGATVVTGGSNTVLSVAGGSHQVVLRWGSA